MAWTSAKTWSIGELVLASDLNTHIRDNLQFLKGQAGTITLEDILFIQAQSGTVTHSLTLSGLTTTTTTIKHIHQLKNAISTTKDVFVLATTWLDDSAGSEDSKTDVQTIIAGVQPITIASFRQGLVLPDAGGDPEGGDEGRGTVNAVGLRAEILRVYNPTAGNQNFSVETKQSATAAAIEEVYFQDDATTTDGAATTIHTVGIPTSRVITLDVRVIARRTGGTAGAAGDGAYYYEKVTYKNVGGTVTEIGTGSTNPIVEHESQAAWDTSFTISGTDVLIQVTGAVNNNVSWHMTLRRYTVAS